MSEQSNACSPYLISDTKSFAELSQFCKLTFIRLLALETDLCANCVTVSLASVNYICRRASGVCCESNTDLFGER